MIWAMTGGGGDRLLALAFTSDRFDLSDCIRRPRVSLLRLSAPNFNPSDKGGCWRLIVFRSTAPTNVRRAETTARVDLVWTYPKADTSKQSYLNHLDLKYSGMMNFGLLSGVKKWRFFLIGFEYSVEKIVYIDFADYRIYKNNI